MERFLEKVLVERFALFRLNEGVCKAEDLKTVAITDDPKLQLTPVRPVGRNLLKVRQTSLLFDGSIDTRPPAT